MDMKKAFVSLGIGVLVVTSLIQSGVIDVNQVFTTGDSAQGIDLAGKTLDEKMSGGAAQNQSTSQSSRPTNQTLTQQAIQQPIYNESEWVKVGEKTCMLGWENKDSHKGWCSLGKFGEGEYRVVLKTSTAKVQWQTGITANIPLKGFSIDDFSQSPAGQEYFKNWTLVKNDRVGEVIVRVSYGSPMDANGSVIIPHQGTDTPNTIEVSRDFPPEKSNWTKPGSEITGADYFQVLKKKS